MARFRPEYTTLNRVRAIDEIEKNADDELLVVFIRQASAWISQHANRQFVPFVDTYYYDAYSRQTYGQTLYLDDADLLSVSQLTINGVTIPSDQYVLQPNNTWPKTQIRLKAVSIYDWDEYSDTPEQSISITGTFGYHDDWLNAWTASNATVQSNPLTDTSSTLLVSDAAGFEVRQYLRIEDEYLQITAVDTDTDTLTVTRGALGTTAAEHAQGTGIDTYQQVPDIRLGTEKLAVYLYQHRDSVQDVIQALDTGVTIRSDAIAFAKAVASMRRRLYLGAT